MKLQFPLALTLLLLLCINTASARIPAPDEELQRWEGSIEFGYTDTTGNTQDTNIKSAADLTFRTGQWRNVSHFDSLNSEADGTKTAEKYYATNRLGWLFTNRDYIWQSLSYEDDKFNGYEYTASAALGYGRNLLEYETMDWLIEVGPGYRVSKVDSDFPDEDDNNEVIFRIFSQYQWRFTETSVFDQELGSEIGEDKAISRSLSSLSVQIIGALMMKLSYEIKYTDKVPDDKKKKDTTTSLSLMYKF